MKEISYRNLTSPKNRRRALSVSEKADNKEYFTHTQRIFIYVVEKEVSEAKNLAQPLFYILKLYDTKTHREKFYFRVKGFFYLVKGEKFLLVHFCHSLKIDILHKDKVF